MSLLTEALAYLRELAAGHVPPVEALRRLEPLRRSAPEQELELVWEVSGPEGDVHYDLLIRGPEGGTISLGYCPEQAVPWPLRGVQRWSDQHVVRVNGEPLDVETVLGMLDFVWSDSRLLTKLVDTCLIRQELRRRGLKLSDAELQQAMNAFRLQRGLGSVEDTRRWLAERGLSLERLEQHVEFLRAGEKLAEETAGGGEEDCEEASRAARAERFREWLEARRREARIEWYWGPS